MPDYKSLLTVGSAKVCTISRNSSIKCQITWTLECCLVNCWSQTGHSDPMFILFGLDWYSCRLLFTKFLSANRASNLEWTKAICLATFCDFSPRYEHSGHWSWSCNPKKNHNLSSISKVIKYRKLFKGIFRFRKKLWCSSNSQFLVKNYCFCTLFTYLIFNFTPFFARVRVIFSINSCWFVSFLKKNEQ